jgi:hypothetical protein
MTNPNAPATTADGGRAESREGEPDIQGDTQGSGGTDAARGMPGEMAQHGGDASLANGRPRQAGHEPATSSQGSRTGSLLGSQSERTGMGDGTPSGNSQGLAGGQDNGSSPDSGERP